MSVIHHHPDDNLMVEFSAGTLEWAVGIAVSAHLHYCTRCKARVSELNRVGGNLLDQGPRADLQDDAVTRALARINALQPHEAIVAKPTASTPAQADKTDKELNGLPQVICKAVGSSKSLKWRSVSRCLKTARIPTGQNKYEVAFHKIGQGGKVVEHGHRGTEITLVLRGSFSDEDGVYTKGDFLVREPGQVHRPTATQNEDCLCLSVLEAPVAVTGALGRLLNPFLRVRPA